MAELLLELFSEDLPSRMQSPMAEQLAQSLSAQLKAQGLDFQSVEIFYTPRRLGLVMQGLPTRQDDTTEERRGPRTDAPQQAIEGFLKGNGLNSLDECVQKQTEKGTFWFVEIHKKGVDTKQALATIIPQVIENLQWPKSMNWGAGRLRYARPLQTVLALFDGAVIEGAVALGGDSARKISFGNQTKGHRFLSSEILSIKNYADYKTQLEKSFVFIDPKDRMEKVRAAAENLAQKENLNIHVDENLMREIIGLVEYPVALCGTFDAAFLSVPSECLVSTMKTNQRYIPLYQKDGKLSNRFIVIANNKASDNGATIIKGNEKVLAARLSDAKFFWDQDLKIKLADRLPRLQDLKFHEKLGNLGDKSARLERLVPVIAQAIDDKIGTEKAALAGRLAKADLVSQMVFEFPELQGIAGGYLARQEELGDDVSAAIAQHYKPVGLDDNVPDAPLSVAVAMADKLDSLAGFFGVDERPTGSKDPFALRRAALGIIRLILDNGLRLDLKKLLEAASGFYDAKFKIQNKSDDLMAFFYDRLKVALKEQGIRHDVLDAVFSLGHDGDLTRIVKRAEALQAMLKTEDGINLLAGYRRAANIVDKEQEKKTLVEGELSLDKTAVELFKQTNATQAEEQQLTQSFIAIEDKISSHLHKEDYAETMRLIAGLRAPIDAFFDKVTVNDNDADKRLNRLRLLAHIRKTLNQVADFSKIEG